MDNYGRMTWLVIIFWVLFCSFTLNYNGPFFDEGIYITAGIRTLEGYGYSDNYLTWFGGSLIWPVLSALAYRVAALMGARMLVVIIGAVVLAALARAAHNLFGREAAFWTTLAFALNGAWLSMARLAVYDTLALAGIAVSFWAVTELKRRDHRGWLVVAAIAFTVGMFTKYPMGLMLFPLLGVLYFLRRERFLLDVGIFGVVSTAITLAFFLPLREQLAALPSWRLQNSPEFGVSLQVIALAIFYLSAAPFALAVIGWVFAEKRRGLASVLLPSMSIWPLYHLLLGDPVGTNKHVVFGFLFAYPLVGLTLHTLWGGRRFQGVMRRVGAVIIILALVGLGWTQVWQSDWSWPDVRPAADYLVRHVEAGDRLLINESWPFTLYLYTQSPIDSPWAVFDAYRITHEDVEASLCEFDWLVTSQGSYAWPASIAERLEQCPGFRETFTTFSTVVGLANSLEYVSYPVRITVYRNDAEGGIQ